ncbi:MAG: translation initiation factor IF-3 [Limnochordaceae bacterium]|nr:translation initiation factor IF-3 [Limnochordaceae bacterium]
MRQELRVNEEIRAREVRVVSPEGQQLGILPVREALRLAHERDLDLVEIAPHANPPVCRLMNYGKYKYEQSKKEREARKRQKIVDLKEIRMTPKIEDHDFEVKRKAAERFLSDGDKVKITVRFRGREIVHSDLARTMLNQLAQSLGSISTVERPPRIEGRHMIMILAPRTDVQANKPAAAPAAPVEATGSPAGVAGGRAAAEG